MYFFLYIPKCSLLVYSLCDQRCLLWIPQSSLAVDYKAAWIQYPISTRACHIINFDWKDLKTDAFIVLGPSKRYLNFLSYRWYIFNTIPAEKILNQQQSFLSEQELICVQAELCTEAPWMCSKPTSKRGAQLLAQCKCYNAKSYPYKKLGESSQITYFACSSASVYRAHSPLGLKVWLRPMWGNISRSSWVLIIILHQMSGSFQSFFRGKTQFLSICSGLIKIWSGQDQNTPRMT